MHKQKKKNATFTVWQTFIGRITFLWLEKNSVCALCTCRYLAPQKLGKQHGGKKKKLTLKVNICGLYVRKAMHFSIKLEKTKTKNNLMLYQSSSCN